MLFTQVVDEDLGCASYVVGDESAGVAVVVDPGFDLRPYLAEAERRGVEIVRTLETHTHADHVSGHGRLALEHGVPVSVHPAGEPEFPCQPLEDGAEIELGDVAVTVLHTPGHRPEHCAFAVADRSRADEPWLVLTGDSLFVGDAARPDLAVEAREGARHLFGSLHRLLELPDGVEVYPGHVAGSLCGAAMSSKASTTIGFERRFNALLQLHDEQAFVDASAGASATVRPPNVERIVGLNRGPFVGAPPPPKRIGHAKGMQLLDVRAAGEFGAGHLPGAVNVPVSGRSFGTKAGFVLDPELPLVLRASSDAEAALAARRLNAVGFLDVRGWLEPPAEPERVASVELDELERLLAVNGVEVLDVREADERVRGYIAGSRHVPFHLLRACCDDLEADGPVVTICESGSRAGVAASLLAARGIEARPVLEGGMSAWRARGGATVEFRRCG